MADQAEKKYSTFWGAVAIAGTVTGGGMFTLPVNPAGAWFLWGAFTLVIVQSPILHSGLLLLEANLNYPVGFGFNTITKDLIGNTWNIISGTAVALALYILAYAYISASSVVINETISMNLDYHADPRIVGICTAISVANVSRISSLAASRITSLLLGLKIISFVIVFGSFFFQVDYSILRDTTNTTAGTSYLPHIFMALSACLASSSFYGNIPSLIICYGERKDKLIKSAVFGPLLVLVVYLFWLYCTIGNIPHESFKVIISSGGNIDSLVKSLLGTKQHGVIEFYLLAFSNLAITSSFFDVALGLPDYPTDLFKIDSSHSGRFKTVPLTFLSSTLLYSIFPNGFIYGIGGAGLRATIWAVIIPAVLVIKARKRFPNQMSTIWDGNLTPVVVILFGITMILCWFGNVFNMLSKFG